MELVINVDIMIGLIAASFTAYYIILEMLDWFKVISEGLKSKKEFVIQSIPPIQTDNLPNEILNIIEELKTTVALQTAIPPKVFDKATTPDLSDIKLSGLTTKVKDKVVNL